MYRVTVRFYQELDFFLPPERRRRPFDVTFPNKRSVKDLIESLGVPHIEVDLILANGRSVPFSYRPGDGDRISVYPVFERLDIGGVSRLRPVPLRTPRFVLDVHLGALARRLRILGFDTRYDPRMDDAALAAASAAEGRILLTRDTRLLMRGNVDRGLYVRNTDPDTQAEEIVLRLDLGALVSPFKRCASCNGVIERLPPEGPEFDRLSASIPPGVRAWCSDFRYCPECGKVYWKGSHYNRLLEKLPRLSKRGESSP